MKDVKKTYDDIDKHSAQIDQLGTYISAKSIEWNFPSKDELKQMSKREIAEALHYAGIMTTIDFFMHHSAIRGSDIVRIIEELRKIPTEKGDPLEIVSEQMQVVMAVMESFVSVLSKAGFGQKEIGRIMDSIDPNTLDFDGQKPLTSPKALFDFILSSSFKGNSQAFEQWARKNGTWELAKKELNI